MVELKTFFFCQTKGGSTFLLISMIMKTLTNKVYTILNEGML